MPNRMKSRDRPVWVNFKSLMRYEAPEHTRELPQKPVCKEYPECSGCPYPGHGFICWPGNCMKKEMERINGRNAERA